MLEIQNLVTLSIHVTCVTIVTFIQFYMRYSKTLIALVNRTRIIRRMMVDPMFVEYGVFIHNRLCPNLFGKF